MRSLLARLFYLDRSSRTCWSFLAGLLLLFLFADVAYTQDPCQGLYASAQAAYDNLQADPPASYDTFLTHSQIARACDGDATPARLRTAYFREIYVLQLLRDFQQALTLLNEFEERFADRPDTRTRWWLYSTRGTLNYYLNNLTEAVHYYPLALQYASTSPSPYAAITVLLNLADAFQRLRDYPSARHYRAQANAQLQALDASATAWKDRRIRFLHGQSDLIALSIDMDTPGRQDSLLKIIDMANEWLALSLDGSPDNQTVWAYAVLAGTHTALEDFETSQSYYAKALQLASELDDDFLVYGITNRLGRFYMKSGRLDDAERTLLVALSMIDAALHKDQQRRTLNDVGYLYELRNEPTRAETYYLRAIGVTEEYHESLRLTEWSAMALGEWQAPYRGLVRVLLDQSRFEEAFLALERTRARHLQDLRTRSYQLDRLSPEQQMRYDSLTTLLSKTNNQLARDTLSTAQRDVLLLERTRLIAERRSLLNLGDPLVPPSPETLQQILQERNQKLISYFIDSEDALPYRPAQSYAFVLTPDTLTATPLPVSEDSVRTLLAQVSPLVLKTDAEASYDARLFSLAPLHKLYDALYAPVAPYLGEHDRNEQERLVIIPDGPLFMLPFGMLVETGVTGFRYQEAPFLVKKHPLSVELATALMLPSSEPRVVGEHDIIAFGKSDFTRADLPGMFQTVAAGEAPLPDLPAVHQEIDAIEALFRKALTFRDGDATEAAFFSLAPDAKILHLASHTLLRPSSPLHNAIILSPDSQNTYDGILYLHEIQQQHLTAQLVVLSGCSTARGVFHPGEGMAGLQYVFRAIGVQSSLATSWFVEDQTALTLTKAFYRNLQRGMQKDVALQQAQLAYLEQAGAENASPFFWAAPVLYGDTVALDLERSFPVWLLWFASIFILLCLLYLGSRLFRALSSKPSPRPQ